MKTFKVRIVRTDTHTYDHLVKADSLRDARITAMSQHMDEYYPRVDYEKVVKITSARQVETRS